MIAEGNEHCIVSFSAMHRDQLDTCTSDRYLPAAINRYVRFEGAQVVHVESLAKKRLRDAYGPRQVPRDFFSIVASCVETQTRIKAAKIGVSADVVPMRDTGLTHGGFYKHFRNKDDLLGESVGEAFREVGARLAQLAEHVPPGEGWKAIVKWYLSPDHCDHPETGCPLAALAPELARSGPEVKNRIRTDMVDYRGLMLPFMPRQKGGGPRKSILRDLFDHARGYRFSHRRQRGQPLSSITDRHRG